MSAIHLNTISKDMSSVLDDLMNAKDLDQYVLVGGTALSLQIGHRKSVDLDMFTSEGYDPEVINNKVKELYPEAKKIYEKEKTIGRSGSIGFNIKDVKVEFVHWKEGIKLEYDYFMEQKTNWRILNQNIIAAMKLNTILNRNEKKDYVDLAILMKTHSLKTILDEYQKYYPYQEVRPVLEKLDNYRFAEGVEPELTSRIDWQSMIQQEYKRYYLQREQERNNAIQTRMTKAEASARKYQENKALADRFVENISIADYLLSKGFIKVRGEKNLYQSEALGRKIHVNTKGREELCFDVLNGKIGNIINLVRKLEDCTFPQAIEHLKNYNPALALTHAPAPKRQKEPEVTIEGHADKYQDEFKTTKAIDLSAFKKHRGIDADVLESSIFKDTVKFYKRENKYGFAFPILNGDHKVGLHVKNLLLDRKETVKHSLRGKGLGHSNLSVNPTKICVTEDPIDAMSHWVLNGKPANIAYFYTFGRPTPEQYELILDHQKQLGSPALIVGFDNDFYGMRYCHELAQRRLPKGQRQDSHEALQYDKEKEVYTWKGKAYENTRENRTKTITEIQKLSGADFEVHTPITKDFNDDLNKNLINKYINKMEEVNKNEEVKAKIEIIEGFLPRAPRAHEKDGNKHYSLQVGTETPDGVNYRNVRVSAKVSEGVESLKAGDNIKISGYHSNYTYKDKDGAEQTYEYLQAGKPIEKVQKAAQGSGQNLSETGDKAKAEVITGYLPQELKEHIKDGELKYLYFSLATKTEEGEIDYKNVRVSPKVSEGTEKLYVADTVEVVAYPVEYNYTDKEGNEKVSKYYQAAKPVEKIMDQKISIEGNLGDDVKVQSYENGDKAYFPIAVKKEGSEETKWYNASAGSKFFDRESLPEKGDLIKVTGYVQKSSNPKFNDTLRVAESIEVKIKKGVRLENEEKKKTQGMKI